MVVRMLCALSFGMIAVISLPRPAQAVGSCEEEGGYWVCEGNDNANDMIFGCIWNKTVVCISDGTSETFYQLRADCDYGVRVTLRAKGGNDWIEMVRSTGPYLCGNRTETWHVPHYGSGWVDVYGGTGGDWILGGLGDHILHGDSGQDLVNMYSGVGSARGDNGEDRVCSGYAGGGERLYGGNQDDCLHEWGGGADPTTFDCGDEDEYDEFVDNVLNEYDCEEEAWLGTCLCGG